MMPLHLGRGRIILCTRSSDCTPLWTHYVYRPFLVKLNVDTYLLYLFNTYFLTLFFIV